MRKKYLLKLIFAFCALLFATRQSYAQVQFAASYFNLSKPNGGGFNIGDTINIRSTIAVPSGTTTYKNQHLIYVPVGTTYIPNSMRISDVEDVTGWGASPLSFSANSLTDNADGDRGSYSAVTKIATINIGDNATNAAGGTFVGGTTKPLFYTSQSIIVTSINVRITGALNTYVSLKTNAKWATTAGGSQINNIIDSVTNIPKFLKFEINDLIALCNGTTGPNLFTNYNNGTFGSGNTQNTPVAPLGASSPLIFLNISTSNPNDGRYSCVNNTYGNAATLAKVFGVWDGVGDHTGAASPTAGNPATPVGTNGGYALLVNATYIPDVAAADTASNLCESLMYNFQSYFRNVCPGCHADPNSPTGGGAPGVKPNIVFELNNIGQYTTGPLPYTGQWQRKGFTFKTGPAQTQVAFRIRNLANGGGGNDWLLDDITVASCLPPTVVTVAPVGTICANNVLNLTVTASWTSYEYKWYMFQYSTNNGATWNNLTTPNSVAGGNNTAIFSGPPPTYTDSGKIYRIIIASTAAGLSNPNCFYATPSNPLIVYPNPTISAIPPVICKNSPNITPTSTPSGGSFTLNGSPIVVINPTSLAIGTYTLTCTLPSGCFSSDTFSIQQPTITLSASGILCNAGTSTITANGVGAPALTYNINGGLYGASNIFAGLAAGTYTVSVKDGNTCTKTSTIAISQPTALSTTATFTPVPCNGAMSTVTVTAAGGTPVYQYSINGGANQPGNTFSVTAGAYTVTVTDANGCTATTTLTITEPLVLKIAASFTAILCNGGISTITVTGIDGTPPYQYKINAGAYQASNVFAGNLAGVYTVTIKDANNCTKTTVKTITQPVALSVIATSGAVLCNGGTSTITATGAGGISIPI